MNNAEGMTTDKLIADARDYAYVRKDLIKASNYIENLCNTIERQQKEIAELIAERDALAKANEWQDIASAPSGKRVLIHYKNSIGKSRVIKAKYIARFTEESSCETAEGVDEYDIDNDRYTYCEGWWEIIDNWDDFNFVEVTEGNPDGWKPLPAPPATDAAMKESEK